MANNPFLWSVFFLACSQTFSAEVSSSHQKCNCGMTTTNWRTKRIIGSKSAGHNEFPWFANIFYQYEYRCGGSIINDLYVLTAGHCISGSPKRMFVVVGNNELIPRNTTNQLLVSYTTVHERFLSVRHHHDIYDIALIRLANRLNLVPGRVWPVCLPNHGTVLSGIEGTIVASDWTNIRDYKIGFIKKATVWTMRSNHCKKSAIAQYVTGSYDQIICATSSKEDACQGDSGGPLLIQKSNAVVLAGIISWGVTCANPSYPGIYTNVKHFLQWITLHTTDATYCNHSPW